MWSAEDVLGKVARPGPRVVVLDEGGNWKGCGTAWKLAEDGHQVTLVTPDPLVGKELQRTAVDFPLRQRLARLGVRFVCESAITNWTEEAARVVSLLTGEEHTVIANDVVMSTPNRAEDRLANALKADALDFFMIGDAAAPRQAPWAFHDGREAGLAL